MRVLAKDLKKGYVEVQVETADDLWVLKNVIRPGDIVIARTLRDVKVEGSGGKKRLPMVLAIRVKNVYFQPFSTRLRVHGVIVEAPEGYGLRGQHHTFNVDVGSRVAIVKDEWGKADLRRLEKAPRPHAKVLLVAADLDEIAVASLYGQGVRYLREVDLGGVTEREPESLDRVLDKAADVVAEAARSEKADIVVIASVAFLKEELAKRVRERLPKARVLVDSVSVGGRKGIEELMRRDSVKKVYAEAAAVAAEEILSEFEKWLAKDPAMIAYGIDDVKFAVEANAVKKLLVLEDLLSGEDAEEINEILNKAEERGAKIIIVPANSPAAPKLEGLGGIVAVLRYRLERW